MINITEIIADNNITSHKELQLYLYELGRGVYYWQYEDFKKDMLIDKGIMEKCEPIKFDGVVMYYENCKIK